MASSPVKLKDPAFAAVLAFLIPGLGHFYQRRIFKGLLYSVCILGTFFTGMRIGHGQVVYFNWHPPENRTYAYLCQFWVGLPALPALAQARLRSSNSFSPNYVPEHLAAQFAGNLVDENGEVHPLDGTIDFYPQQPDEPRRWSAKLTGTLATPSGATPIEAEVTPGTLEPQVGASQRRRVSGTVEGHVAGKPAETIRGRLEGHIPRPLWNYYLVPLQDKGGNDAGGETELDQVHRQLGSRFELGVVYTMIAGLLNVLAIYDALEGPAYEDEEDEDAPGPQPTPS